MLYFISMQNALTMSRTFKNVYLNSRFLEIFWNDRNDWNLFTNVFVAFYVPLPTNSNIMLYQVLYSNIISHISHNISHFKIYVRLQNFDKIQFVTIVLCFVASNCIIIIMERFDRVFPCVSGHRFNITLVVTQ